MRLFHTHYEAVYALCRMRVQWPMMMSTMSAITRGVWSQMAILHIHPAIRQRDRLRTRARGATKMDTHVRKERLMLEKPDAALPSSWQMAQSAVQCSDAGGALNATTLSGEASRVSEGCGGWRHGGGDALCDLGREQRVAAGKVEHLR
jgi:hypothetical protein